MPFNIFITILIFCALNISILFFIKTRTSRIIAIISSHLMIIFLFDIYLKNFLNFKEFVLAVIIYSMMILFLISNNKFFLSYLKKEEIFIKKNTSHKKIFNFFLPVSIIIFSLTVIILTIFINVPQIKEMIQQKKIARNNQLVSNPLISPSHPAHINIKKFYLGTKYNDRDVVSANINLKDNYQESVKIKDSLKNNIMLKHNSDIMLIIIASMCGLLIFVNKKPNRISA